MKVMLSEKSKNIVVRNTVWMLLGQGVSLGVQFLYFIEIARSLGARNYGAFVGVVALVGIALPFGDLGSGSLLVKRVSQDKGVFGECWGRALVSTGVSAAVLSVALLVFSRFVLSPSIPLRLVLLVSGSDLFGLNITQICAQAFQSFDLMKWTAAINALTNSSRLVWASIIISIYRKPTALEWGYAYLCSTTVVAGIAVVLVWKKLGPPLIRSVPTGRQIREGLYFSVGLSAQTIYNDIDKTMLTRFGTLEAAGIYGAAYRLIAVSFVPVSSLLSASYANFFRVGANGAAACFSYAKRPLQLALGYSVVACCIVLSFAGLVPQILGGEYGKTVEVLRWLALLPMLKVVSYVCSNVLTGAGYQGLRSCIQVGVALFNVLVNLWVIPLYSWRGAAWSSLASDALLSCGTCIALLLIAKREKPTAVRESVETSDVPV